ATAGVGVLAGDERQVTADNDLGLFVIHGHDVRGGQDVGLDFAFEKARQCAEAEDLANAGNVHLAAPDRDVEAGPGKAQVAPGAAADQLEEVISTRAEVGAGDDADCVASAAGGSTPHPLDAELGG